MLQAVKVNKKYFTKLDLSKIPSPCYVIDTKVLEDNLEVFNQLKTNANVKILLALKAFSLKNLFPIISNVLDGVCASGLNEAKLGNKYFGGLISTYSPAFKDAEFSDIMKYSQHITFNSISQINKYKKLCINKKIDVGIRINPLYSEVEVSKYNSSNLNSRLGIHLNQLDKLDFTCIKGVHFHSLCEQNFDVLENTWNEIWPYLKNKVENLEWINLGGGHHITRSDYNLNKLTNFLLELKKKTNCQIILEPGEAIVFQSGILVGEILDYIHGDNDKIPNIGITDISPVCHMPDVIEAPYRPFLMNESVKGKKVVLGGPSCLAGDIIGEYNFLKSPNVGDKVVFLDQAHYTLVKTNFFNGINHPKVVLWNSDDNDLNIIKSFDFKDFEKRN
tara:strand:- start:773 stop:1942 length:1170 start_codon:yes stop_codon:yes gene_type:complete